MCNVQLRIKHILVYCIDYQVLKDNRGISNIMCDILGEIFAKNKSCNRICQSSRFTSQTAVRGPVNGKEEEKKHFQKVTFFFFFKWSIMKIFLKILKFKYLIFFFFN